MLLNVIDFNKNTGEWFWKSSDKDFEWELHESYQFVDFAKPKVNSKNQTPEYRALMSTLKSGEGNGRDGKEVSEETRLRISKAKKGKQVAYNKGVPMSAEQKQKLSERMKGRKVDPAVLARRVASQTGQKRPKLHCEHCKRDIAVGWFHRHGVNCASINTL